MIRAAGVLLLPGLAWGAVGGSWDKPGANPYVGSKWSAVMSYKFPTLTKIALANEVVNELPTARVTITKTAIVGDDETVRYSPALNGMHFGGGVKAGDNISRAGWAPDHTELASVWCRGTRCIVIPDVCGNVSWTTRELLPAHGIKAAHSAPEPGALALVGIALAAMAVIRRKDAHA